MREEPAKSCQCRTARPVEHRNDKGPVDGTSVLSTTPAPPPVPSWPPVQLGLRVARSQDPRHVLPLAVVERHVGSILLHDRPPIGCGSVPARNNPQLCDTAGWSFHIVYEAPRR